MKTVSIRTRDLFMRALLAAANESKSRIISPDDPALAHLRCRSDFTSVMMVLEGLGLISFRRIGPSAVLRYELTPAGNSYFERRAEERNRLIINSIVIPVLVAIITTTVTVYILPTLGRSAQKWLSGSQQHPMQSPAAIETTSAPAQNPQSFQEYPE